MAKQIDIAANEPHTTSEVICVKCGKRWIAVRPSVLLLKDMHCPLCKFSGYVIETGQILKDGKDYN